MILYSNIRIVVLFKNSTFLYVVHTCNMYSTLSLLGYVWSDRLWFLHYRFMTRKWCNDHSLCVFLYTYLYYLYCDTYMGYESYIQICKRIFVHFDSSKLFSMWHFESLTLIARRRFNRETIMGIPHSLLSLSFFPTELTRTRTVTRSNFFAEKISQTQVLSARFGSIWT